MTSRLRIAIQKSGRLSEKSVALLMKCGLDFDLRKDRLIHQCREFPVDLMLVRDDDIPEYIADGVCHLGIVGENVMEEMKGTRTIEKVLSLGFGSCRLALALPEEVEYRNLSQFQGLRIATSYPSTLRSFLKRNGIDASLVELGGSVEIAPGLKIADAVCDLVSTGGTLKSNGLKEVATVFESNAALFRTPMTLSPILAQDLERLLQRINGVISASQAKYIMMNAPRSALKQIQKILPGMEAPTVIPLGTQDDRIAIHAVAREALFWETIENLKAVGASSILVLPIEKVIL